MSTPKIVPAHTTKITKIANVHVDTQDEIIFTLKNQSVPKVTSVATVAI